MRASALFLVLLVSLVASAQVDRLDSLARHCPCIDDHNLAKAMKHAHSAGWRGKIVRIKCDAASYFFLWQPSQPIYTSIFLNGNRHFAGNDFVRESGEHWFYVRLSDEVDMKYTFETQQWSTERLKAEALGEERY